MGMSLGANHVRACVTGVFSVRGQFIDYPGVLCVSDPLDARDLSISANQWGVGAFPAIQLHVNGGPWVSSFEQFFQRRSSTYQILHNPIINELRRRGLTWKAVLEKPVRRVYSYVSQRVHRASRRITLCTGVIWMDEV